MSKQSRSDPEKLSQKREHIHTLFDIYVHKILHNGATYAGVRPKWSVMCRLSALKRQARIWSNFDLADEIHHLNRAHGAVKTLVARFAARPFNGLFNVFRGQHAEHHRNIAVQSNGRPWTPHCIHSHNGRCCRESRRQGRSPHHIFRFLPF